MGAAFVLHFEYRNPPPVDLVHFEPLQIELGRGAVNGQIDNYSQPSRHRHADARLAKFGRVRALVAAQHQGKPALAHPGGVRNMHLKPEGSRALRAGHDLHLVALQAHPGATTARQQGVGECQFAIFGIGPVGSRDLESRRSGAEVVYLDRAAHYLPGLRFQFETGWRGATCKPATLRSREDYDSQRLNYDLFYNTREGSTLQVGLEYDRDHSDQQRSDRYHIDTSWRTVLNHGGGLSIGTGYGYSDDRSGNNAGWNGYLSYDLAFGAHWGFSAQMDYNRTEYDLDGYDLSDSLFTDNELVESRHGNSEQFSLLVNVTYAFGGLRESGILGASGNRRGAGTVRGRLFLDTNGDGIAQSNEYGVAGVRVYLDSIYPVTTDARGEFDYPAVSPGEHFIFVDESLLPLPWGLNGVEYTPLRVNLRGTTRVDIPVTKLGTGTH